ncbi:unnamed protein product [Boreogadus saida]
MAMDVMAMIKTSLSDSSSNDQGQSRASTGPVQSSGQSRATPSTSSGTPIQHNMSRAFPGMFKNGPRFQKKRPAGKMSQMQFLLLDATLEKTPKPSREMVLLQAGLGRRTINIPEASDHQEIADLLSAAYPKMCDLEGAWMLHKAMGGSGQRRLNLVSPDETGYTGAGLTRACGGKGCLYIMPIQHTLSTDPLPFTASEFKDMPKARCVTCSQSVPLQLLSLHVDTCSRSEPHSGHEDADGDDMGTTVYLSSSDTPEVQTTCPICEEWVASDIVEIHASTCGERECDEAEYGDGSQAQKSERVLGFSDISDLMKTLNERVDTSTTFSICVTREDIVERGLKQWQRQKRSSPQNTLRVTFLGEPGIDNGALKKEFLTEMVAGIERRFFEGGTTGKTPKYSITDVGSHNFKTIGEIFAVSIVQGGPPPNFFMPWCYDFISTGELDYGAVTEDDVADLDLKKQIQQIRAADDVDVLEIDKIVACGYTGPISIQKKEEIVRAVVLHATVRLVPILQQLCSGLVIYDLLGMVRAEKDICRQLFAQELSRKVDSDFLVRSLSPVFSEKGTVKRQRESRIINHLQDYIQDLEDKGADGEMEGEGHLPDAGNENQIDVGKFCQWLTGQSHIPLGQADREDFKIVIEFDHDCEVRYGTHGICYPVVNACSRSVTLPVVHLGTSSELRDVLSKAIVYGFEFGRC